MAPMWLPLESNPDVLNGYAWKLGLSDTFAFHDIYGLDPDLLGMVPQPVKAVLLLFPINEASEKARDEDNALLTSNKVSVSPSLWYTKQTIGNACGTIGLLHAILNNIPSLQFAPDSWFTSFFDKTKGKDANAKAELLEGEDSLSAAHTAVANEGQSEVPAEDTDVNLHFICFVCVDGTLYELDGRKLGPVPHGPSSPETVLQDTAKVVQSFIDRAEGNIQFNLMALSSAAE